MKENALVFKIFSSAKERVNLYANPFKVLMNNMHNITIQYKGTAQWSGKEYKIFNNNRQVIFLTAMKNIEK